MTEPLQPGQRLGAYRIIRPLGGGGMGQVYEAEHVSLGVRRALKVFTTESHHIDFLRKRFIAEGRILADLDHPRIVHVYDLVVDDETGTPYFAMDLVLSPDGTPRTLENEREAGVSEEKVAMWFKDICEGLAYIHSHKVVHRDISLDNILIGPDGHAVISDFGIAKIVDDNYRRKINVTVTMASKDAKDLCMGKGNYMAPDLKRGGTETAASDAWALGVLLFRLLTGFWYEPNKPEKTKDLLSACEYNWDEVIGSLCDFTPKMRLPENGISEAPLCLHVKPQASPFWRKKWFFACLISGLFVLGLVLLLKLLNSHNESGVATNGQSNQVNLTQKWANDGTNDSKVIVQPVNIITNYVERTNVVQSVVVKTNIVEREIQKKSQSSEVAKQNSQLQEIQRELRKVLEKEKQAKVPPAQKKDADLGRRPSAMDKRRDPVFNDVFDTGDVFSK